jgi:hypothetical protein
MSEIVNLRRVRKAKARAAAADQAAENRARFGIPKSERLKTTATQDLDNRRLDGHRRLPDSDRSDA